ncbi:glycosyltransferase [Proteus sp. G2658]|uniref:Gt1 n=1 Tax=Proteus penneri TaxID=102862 RepID=A0A385JNW0_9GAMM|nr:MULTISPECIES: glycosyltransferase family 2 protein [Proteus]AXY99988.1 gt1 [Proteus penneri]NBM91393.1 glycosyltransferase [Proteus sp. G2658]
MKKLVSILVPCYNSESLIQKLLQSILSQDYPYIEVIVINDGSTDNSLSVIYSYLNEFEKKGYILKIISQKNAGQASAINNALQYFSGDYLSWIDADDWLEPSAIADKVKYLERNLEYGLVRSDVSIYFYPNYKIASYKFSDKMDFSNENIFDDLILENNVYFCPGGYLVRTTALKKVLPNLKIINSRAGQNWQILLPLTLEFKCGYINKPLFNYLIRENSHSRKEKDKIQELKKLQSHEELLKKIIYSLKLNNKKKYAKIIEKKYLDKKISIYYKYNDIKNILKLTLKRKNIKSIIKSILVILKLTLKKIKYFIN